MRSLTLPRLVFLLMAAILLSSSLGLAQAPPGSREPHCAFADDRFSTWLAIADCVADYFVKHRTWPSTTRQLRTHAERRVAAEPPIAAKPSKADFDAFFARFSVMEFTPQKKNLLVTLRFRAAGGVHRERVIFHPGRTVEDILQGITPK